MITKGEFLKCFGDSEENIEKLYLMYVNAFKSGQDIVTNEFYTNSVCGLLGRLTNNIGLSVFSYGFSEDPERELIAFSSREKNIEVFDNVAKVIKISYNDKFNKLNHRDFLGSIMSLGFAREKMGDLVLEGNCVYFPVVIEFVDYIMQNLKKVRNVSVSVNVELFNKLPNKKIEILYVVVASLRIDVIVSAVVNTSREKSKKLIQNRQVKLNGSFELNFDAKVCENDLIVVTRYGKFKIKESLGSTSKNKIKLVIHKFI